MLIVILISDYPRILGNMEFIDSNEWIPVHYSAWLYECCIEYYVNTKVRLKALKDLLSVLLKPKTSKTGYPRR